MDGPVLERARALFAFETRQQNLANIEIVLSRLYVHFITGAVMADHRGVAPQSRAGDFDMSQFITSHMSRLAMIAASAAALVIPPTAPADAMNGYRWKNRPLLIFTPTARNAAFQRQSRLLAGNRGGLANRDMVVIRVVGDRVLASGGRGPGMSAAALRKRYGVSRAAFRAILVGKDGGAKISSSQPLSTRRLFATIDAMPMRRQEMRKRGR